MTPTFGGSATPDSKGLEDIVLTKYTKSYKPHGFDNDMAIDLILFLLESS